MTQKTFEHRLLVCRSLGEGYPWFAVAGREVCPLPQQTQKRF
jgi:hypothetical protein